MVPSRLSGNELGKAMEKIESKLEPGRLLHFIHRSSQFGPRVDLIPSSEILQLSSQRVEAGRKFPAHIHIPKKIDLHSIIAQESWVVLRGEVEVTYFDLDGTELAKSTIFAGDTSVTLAGGHGYLILEDSEILEFKTGPYLGQELDKVFI